MSTVQKLQQNVKASTGHPMLNMIILGTSSGLMTMSAISGFISYGKLGNELSGTKKLLLSASLLSLLSAILLGVGIFLIHRHSTRMETAFKGFFSFTLLFLAGLFMLISGILYAIVAAELVKQDVNNPGQKYKDIYGTSYTTAVLSALLTLGGMGAIGISFLFAILAMRKKKIMPTDLGLSSVTTKVHQEPSYTNEDGAEIQLQQLQLGTGTVGRNVNPTRIGTQ